MNECVNKYFIHDEDIRNCQEFDENVLNKGKSLYEVIRIIEGKPLFFQNHLDRLENSAKLTKLKLWFTKEKIKEKLMYLIKVNDIGEGNVKLLFNFEENIVCEKEKKTFLCYFVKHHYPSLKDYKNGVHTILYHGERKNPSAKVINTNFRNMVDKEIKANHAFEAILVDRNGHITEGSKSNIFMVKDKSILTAPVGDVLPGTTRNIIIDACEKLGLNVLEKKVRYRDIEHLDALFISGTSPKVLPIKSVDNMNFNSSQNELIIKIINSYEDTVREDILNYGVEVNEWGL